MSELKIRTIKGKDYAAMPFRINSERDDGTPWECDMMKPHDVAELSRHPEKNKFMVCWVPIGMISPKRGDEEPTA